jgi:hypothetical protein
LSAPEAELGTFDQAAAIGWASSPAGASPVAEVVAEDAADVDVATLGGPLAAMPEEPNDVTVERVRSLATAASPTFKPPPVAS